MLTTGLLAALVHALAWGGYASVSALRLGGWALAALGVLELSSWRLEEAKRILHERFSKASLAERCALALSIVTVIGLFAAALGPATDADSLDYHLARATRLAAAWGSIPEARLVHREVCRAW